MEDDLEKKTPFDGGQPLMEDNNKTPQINHCAIKSLNNHYHAINQKTENQTTSCFLTFLHYLSCSYHCLCTSARQPALLWLG